MLMRYWFLQGQSRLGCLAGSSTCKLIDVSSLTSNRMTNAKRTAEVSQNCGVKL